MNDDLGIVILGGAPVQPPMVLMMRCVPCIIAVFEEARPDITQLLVFKQPTPSVLSALRRDFILRESSWERRNRNAPWWRQFSKRRR